VTEASSAISVSPRGLAVDAVSISKSYGGAHALQDVSLSIAAGEIHGLVGENGAGKSTLGKIIAGAVVPDSGTIALNGAIVRHHSPRNAIGAGIGLIEQELAIVPTLSVLDNVFLGQERTRLMRLDRREQRRRFAALAERVGFVADSRARAGSLRVAAQQQLEVMRALARDARLIVMDEPTAALSRVEAEQLLRIARDLRVHGVTIVFVSHFLEDVLAIADTVTVLKDGRHVRTAPAQSETVGRLVTSMLGRELDLQFPSVAPVAPDAPPVLTVRGLSRPPAFADIDLEVRAGEIVGLAGLVGSGRSDIARAIFRADRSRGDIAIDGHPLRARTPRQAIRSGIAFVPESRKDQGLVMHRSVLENVSIAHLREVSRCWTLQRRRERVAVQALLSRIDARYATVRLPVSSLSGGNQQKVAVAKWLLKSPRLMIADEPTRGVDVGAKRAIYELLRDLAASGIGVLLISSELEEIVGLSHRVLVIRAGRIVGEFEGAAIHEEAIMRTAFGEIGASSALGGADV
jgi:ABC-type sugar transport system ATPase subunit